MNTLLKGSQVQKVISSSQRNHFYFTTYCQQPITEKDDISSSGKRCETMQVLVRTICIYWDDTLHTTRWNTPVYTSTAPLLWHSKQNKKKSNEN